MDGFEATRRICDMKKTGALRADLPVIALTANAMKGDRQRCLDAGMDDYISKPVRTNDLREKVFSWTNRRMGAVFETTREALLRERKPARQSASGVMPFRLRQPYRAAAAQHVIFPFLLRFQPSPA